MRTDINQLLEKYWQGESSLEEETQLKEHFASGSQNATNELATLFGVFSSELSKSSSKDLPTNLEVFYIESLLKKYWDCETEVVEEVELKNYFNSTNVAKELSEYTSYFQTLSQQSKISGSMPSLDLSNEAPTQKAKVRRLVIPSKWVAIAASFLLAAVVWFNSDEILNPPVNDTKEIYASMTAQEKETYDLTMEALAFMSGKLDKGSSAIRNDFTKVANANIFNTTN